MLPKMKVKTLLVLSVASAGLLFAQNPHVPGTVVIPDSSKEAPGDIGGFAHTNHLVFVHPSFTGTSPAGETPQSIYPVYNVGTAEPGGSGVIVIVDAFDYPSAENDLNLFSSTLGLPTCTTANGCFKVVFASGHKPRGNCGWNQEAALDIEWAHAMAPNAKIVLMEAASNSFSNLFAAVDAATNYIKNNGGVGEVSMSWGGSEFSGETSDDFHFTQTGVVYFAASGDTGGATIYPSASPNVVAAGGTTINRSGGTFASETGWSGSGGGPSAFEPRPGYQANVAAIVGSQRGIPDFSFDADPNSGVSVYDSTSCQGNSGWLVFGGTSVASPSLAGIVNLAGHVTGTSTSQTVLSTIYDLGNATDFRDILSGTAGSFSATTGWDFVTGVGSNQGTSGK
jgi:subtilase family serine protease